MRFFPGGIGALLVSNENLLGGIEALLTDNEIFPGRIEALLVSKAILLGNIEALSGSNRNAARMVGIGALQVGKTGSSCRIAVLRPAVLLSFPVSNAPLGNDRLLHPVRIVAEMPLAPDRVWGLLCGGPQYG